MLTGQANGLFRVSFMGSEREAQAEKHEGYRELFGGVDGLYDEDFPMPDAEMAARRKASIDALSLYSGAVPTLTTPMERFMAMTPTQDAHPWLARNTISASGMPASDLEALDASRLASEMASTEAGTGAEEGQMARAGSPRPSSDTLSVTRYLETRKERKDHSGARNRRKPRMRKRSGVERKPGGSPSHASGL